MKSISIKPISLSKHQIDSSPDRADMLFIPGLSVLKLFHTIHILPLLALPALQHNHPLNIVLSQPLPAVVDMWARLPQFRRILNPPVDLLAPQLQDPDAVDVCEEQAGGDGDLAGSRKVDEAVFRVQRGCGQGLWERRGRSGVEDLVPECGLFGGGRHDGCVQSCYGPEPGFWFQL